MPDSSDSPLRLQARAGSTEHMGSPVCGRSTSAGDATGVAVGEFTGDANIDSAGGNIGVNQISRFTNDGSGDLFARGDYPAGRPLDFFSKAQSRSPTSARTAMKTWLESCSTQPSTVTVGERARNVPTSRQFPDRRLPVRRGDRRLRCRLP